MAEQMMCARISGVMLNICTGGGVIVGGGGGGSGFGFPPVCPGVGIAHTQSAAIKYLTWKGV